MLRENINPIIIVINNDGYTVERYIHGPQRKYNDINMWDYTYRFYLLFYCKVGGFQ